MASNTPKNYLTPLYNTTPFNVNNDNEFNESDIWGSSSPTSSSTLEPKNPIPVSRAPRKPRFTLNRPSEASSLPLNIPDWSKIIGNMSENQNEDNIMEDQDENHDGLEDWLPPHEYVAKKLARTRVVPFSVHEGVGRTLKGRDLSRVRNAVWKQTGFED